MLIHRRPSTLLIVDIQERLLPHIDGWQSVLENAQWLVRVAPAAGVPVMASEQYPKGLGHTHAEIAALLPAGEIAQKQHFSCVAAGCLAGLPGDDRRQVVIAGIESTSASCRLRWNCAGRAGRCSSWRKPSARAGRADKDLALARMRSHGIEIVAARDGRI